MKLPQYKHFTRLDTLDERLTPDFISGSHLGTRARYGTIKRGFPTSHMPEEVLRETAPENHGNLSVVLLLVLSVVIFPKGTDYKPTSLPMKEELRKLTRLPHRYAICQSMTSPPLRFARRQGRKTRRKWTCLPTIGGTCRQDTACFTCRERNA